MTVSNRIDLDEPAPPTSRVLARRIAAEMVERKEIPTAEAIRKQIGVFTNGQMNPSALTIQDEVKKWYAEEFWPTYHAMGTLPEDSSFPAEVRRIYKDGFQTIIVQLLAAARAEFQAERAEYQRQIDDASTVVEGMSHAAGELEQRAAAAEERYLAEAAAHSATKARLDALTSQVEELNAKLHVAYEKQSAHDEQLNEVRTAERARADEQVQAAYVEGRRHLVEIDNLRQRVQTQELSLSAQTSENRRLVQAYAKAESEVAALRTEVTNIRSAHAGEMERMTATLRAAHAGAGHAERMKTTLRSAGGKPNVSRTSGLVRRSLHKPTRG